MTRTFPAWISGVCVYLATGIVGAGAVCWIAPHLLFGSEGYRTVARGIIWTLGALALGIGAGTVWAALKQQLPELKASLRIIVLAFSGLPAVAFYNLGAVEPLRQATGINIFLLVGGVLLLLLLPASLALFALGNVGASPCTREAK